MSAPKIVLELDKRCNDCEFRQSELVELPRRFSQADLERIIAEHWNKFAGHIHPTTKENQIFIYEGENE